jgi:DNA-binding NtrC family response regulator
MKILLVDDETLGREALASFIEEQLGHQVVEADSGLKALEIFRTDTFPVVVTDIRMPGLSGLELLSRLKKLPKGKNADIVLITGYADVSSAVQALRRGAYDYLQKPINVEEFAAVIERIVEHQYLLKENVELTQNFEKKVKEATEETNSKLQYIQSIYSEMVGIGKIMVFSDAMRSAVELAEKLHHDRNVPVLIEGETGTGKEIIARLIHYGRGGVTSPFITINCSAITPSLFESELFGYVEGAFTDARKKGMVGKFEMAQGGTIFLDEIGDLPLDMQPKLLRALQEREIYRIGGMKKIRLDVRFICATNRELDKLVQENKFRKDLYYRLNVGRIYIPPLRERKEAIMPLAQMFLDKYASEKKKGFKRFHKEAVKILENHDWEGNVRELQNTIERVVLLNDGDEVIPEHLRFLTSDKEVSTFAASLAPGHIVLPPDKIDLKSIEREIVKKTLKMFKGNKTRSAEYLGLTRSALRSRLGEMDS